MFWQTDPVAPFVERRTGVAHNALACCNLQTSMLAHQGERRSDVAAERDMKKLMDSDVGTVEDTKVGDLAHEARGPSRRCHALAALMKPSASAEGLLRLNCAKAGGHQ